MAAALTNGLHTSGNAVLDASDPVRDASYTGLPFPGVNTYTGRGAADIDDTVATATSVALAFDHEHADGIRLPRTIALIGDLTFQYDFAVLAVEPLELRPESLATVVTDGTGGDIFEALEAGNPALRESFEHIFDTPQDVDFKGTCQTYGVGYMHVNHLPDLLTRLHPDTNVGSIRIIKVVIMRMTRRQLHHKLMYNAEIGMLDRH